MNTNPVSTSDAFLKALSTLPDLPRVIEYEDDYEEVVRTIKTADCEVQAPIYISGRVVHLKFLRLADRVRPLLRTYLLFGLQTLSTHTVSARFNSFVLISPEDVEELAVATPMQAYSIWPRMIASYKTEELAALKVLLAFLCRINFVNWTPLHVDMVSHSLAGISRDAYAKVRSGDCFLSVHEEAALIRWLDDAAASAEKLSLPALQEACLLTCAYQFGMRPKQLGMARIEDLAIRRSSEDGSVVAHLTFKMIKQRDQTLQRIPLVRKIRREWAPLFDMLIKRCEVVDPRAYLFGFTNREELSRSLIESLDRIVPDAGITAYDLRHSMAQRLVDAGANKEELASAMGHTSLRSGLVYFQSSANQAELVNKALGASEVYQTVVKISKAKFIAPEELAELRGESQVGGVPHGIPIAGIGGCEVGQGNCSYNPVTACYGCPKFMPVRDLSLHEQVLQEFRGVVTFFKDGGHGDMSSPAYLQLQRTIAQVQSVIQDLQESENV